MENIVLTQLSIPDIRRIFRQELESYFDNSQSTTQKSPEQLLTVEQTATFLNLAVPTIYSLVQRREIPVNKRGKRLYFSEQELRDWVKAGRKKTQAELKEEANDFVSRTKKRG